MSDRLKAPFNIWLARYQPPAHIRGKSEILQAEADALLKAVIRHAPSFNCESWLENTLAEFDRTATSRTWPTVREIETAAGKAHLALGPKEAARSGWRIDVAAITARRIRNHEAFAQSHLTGGVADEMLRRGLIGSSELAALRKVVAAQYTRRGYQ
ncbi:MAG: hypothetical protein GXP05_06375 [Alphaproteobacteria bacterium]|nr:hypothetical protein [Alphaproteobacteria bacterium]